MRLPIQIAVASIAITLVGCGGRNPNPVAEFKVGDDGMRCTELKAEMAFIDTQVAKLIPEGKKTGKNVALGVTGWFLIVPWFFMDFSDAERVEIEAYQGRYLALEKLYVRKNCVQGDEVVTASSSAAGSEAEEPPERGLNRRTLNLELVDQCLGYITDASQCGCILGRLGQRTDQELAALLLSLELDAKENDIEEFVKRMSRAVPTDSNIEALGICEVAALNSEQPGLDTGIDNIEDRDSDDGDVSIM